MDLAPRARLVGTAAGKGTVVGAVVTLVVGLVIGDVVAASELVFALGALALGGSLLGWSGSVMVGDAVEARNALLETNSDWTEAKSRRAMARIGGFGVGTMVGSSVVAAVAFAV
ncbi:DUF7268 family protein [Haloarchaeobius sp. DFWS5]|uniref:DUF7268 family protein n=1 Tax=Haloarchaeobius sp. DFWS5 TaxID=3446114 RepID=UPI003EB74B7B